MLSTCCHQAKKLKGSGNESRARGLNWTRRDFLATPDRYLAKDYRVAASWFTVLTMMVRATSNGGGIVSHATALLHISETTYFVAT